MKPERTPIMEGNEIEKAARKFASSILGIPAKEILPDDTIFVGFTAGANWQKERENAELTRTNAQLDEMVTKYNELSKKYDDLYSKYYGK